ncbi:hypothetical protein VNO77_03767 [Canavalia gladiata]|uniref:Uncharacterized protein n=1 Tax=Canavalia gladiata TaxID=3824 RepID=A0AAN9N0F4_CANGL
MEPLALHEAHIGLAIGITGIEFLEHYVSVISTLNLQLQTSEEDFERGKGETSRSKALLLVYFLSEFLVLVPREKNDPPRERALVSKNLNPRPPYSGVLSFLNINFLFYVFGGSTSFHPFF